MTRDDINSIKIVVKIKKFFIINKENVLFAIINFENDKWSNIDLNDNLNKIINDKRK